MAAVLLQGKPPQVISSVPQGAELSPVEEGPCGLPMCVWPVGWRGCAGEGAAVAMLSPGASHLALQALQVPGCTHPALAMPRQAGLQPQAEEIPTTAPQPCAQDSWGMEQSLRTVAAAPSQVSPGHCPGCADAPGGLSASPISGHPKELAWHSLAGEDGVCLLWGMSHRVSTSGLGSHL